MKTTSLFAAIAFSLGAAAGCAGTEEPSVGASEAAQTEGSSVALSLVYARRIQKGCSSCFAIEGYVEVNRMRQGGVQDDGQVVFWHSNPAQPGAPWSGVNADLVETLDAPGHEVWHFITTDYADAEQFALRYDVHGQSYWDNNKNANYRLDGEGVSVSAELALLGAGHDIIVTDVVPTNEGITGHLLVRQGLGSTAAAVAYGTTGKAGWQSVAAGADEDGLDHDALAQGYSFAIPVGTDVGQVDFAASAQTSAKGMVWDDNFNQNYRCVTTGSVTPQWSCPSSPTLGR